MFERNKTDPRAAAPLTLGAARERLFTNGYEPVSLLTPDGSPPPWSVSEHPVAVRTLARNPLAALVLSSPEDTALDQRIRTVLERRGLTRGPCRLGSDGRELWPLRAPDTLWATSTRDGALVLVCSVALGMGQGIQGALIPLDGSWPRGDLLSVSYAKLPALSSEEAASLFTELESLAPREPYVLPPVRRREPTAQDLAEREQLLDPAAFDRRMHELTGNVNMQLALKARREQLLAAEARAEA